MVSYQKIMFNKIQKLLKVGQSGKRQNQVLQLNRNILEEVEIRHAGN